MSLLVQVQYMKVSWTVDIPRQLCEDQKLSEVKALVRTTAPSSVTLPAVLHYTMLTGAKWTQNNITEMAKENKNYVCLSAEGDKNI